MKKILTLLAVTIACSINAQVQHQIQIIPGHQVLQQLDMLQQQLLMVHLHQGETQKQLEIILKHWDIKQKQMGLRLLH